MKLKSILLCIVVILSIMSPTAMASDVAVYDFTSCIDQYGVATIPAEINGVTITEIPAKAFYNNILLKKVIMPSSIIKINNYAFYKCINLTEIEFSENVTSIGLNAFSYCNALESVKMPTQLTAVSEFAFMGCASLRSVTFNDNISSIGFAAFSNCTSLCDLKFEKGITNIASSAFAGCSSLTEVILPETLIKVNEDTFSGCALLQKIILRSANTCVSSRAYRNSPLVQLMYEPAPAAAEPVTTTQDAPFVPIA